MTRNALSSIRLCIASLGIALASTSTLPATSATGAPQWMAGGDFKKECMDAFGGCAWTFDPGMAPPKPGDRTIGMLIQKVNRIALEYECVEPFEEVVNFEESYFEYWAIRRGAPNEDKFGSTEVSPSTEHYDQVTGEAQFIAYGQSVEFDTLLYHLSQTFDWNEPQGQGVNPVLDDNGLPLFVNGTLIHSGPLPNSSTAPSHGDANWDNNYGGASVDVPDHSMDFFAECCPAHGIFVTLLTCS